MQELRVKFARLFVPERDTGSGVLVIGITDGSTVEIALPARHARILLALDAARTLEEGNPEMLHGWCSFRRISGWIAKLPQQGYTVDRRTVSIYLSQIRRAIRRGFIEKRLFGLPVEQILETRRSLGVRICLEDWEVIDRGL